MDWGLLLSPKHNNSPPQCCQSPTRLVKYLPMKPTLQRIYKFFKLEAERGYDNHAVVGGLERMLDPWEADARMDGVPEEIIQAICARIKDYAHLTPPSRAEMLEGLWKRIYRSQTGNDPPPLSPQLPQTDIEVVTPRPALINQTHQLDVQDEERIKGDDDEGEPGELHFSLGAEPSPSEPAALNAPITVLNGVGPRYAKTLSKLNIYTLRDILYHFPRRYDDYSKLKPIKKLEYGDEVTIIGGVQRVSIRPLRGGKLQLVEAIISDSSGAIRATWFNQPWLARRLESEENLVLAGKVEQYLGRLVMNNPEWEPLDQQQLSTNRIVPVYPLTTQMTQRWLRRLMNQVVTYWAPRIKDFLPQELSRSAELVALSNALLQIHFPDSWEALKAAQLRLAFDEIFLLQLGVLQQKNAWQRRSGRVFEAAGEWLDNLVAQLPYPLTAAQMNSIKDLQQDLSSGHPMNRLLQGDVGSGKTVAAGWAMSIVLNGNAQSALMAPTSILAEQHYHTLSNLFTETWKAKETGLPFLKPEEIRLILGSTPESEKEDIRNAVAEGRVKVLIGTHALLEDPVKFSDLQFIVIDEQHRFGVEQRAQLREKGENPHLLVMTATPIPRSLALTLYGDLDISLIDQMPPGRLPVETYVLAPMERDRAYTLIRSQLDMGRQAFIVYPLVEEGETNGRKAAVEERDYLQKEIFQQYALGLLHGRMPSDEKDVVMQQFRDGMYNILVATSVVEVGIDVQNASVMLIEGANRFGLAQLHQLRGRVGRGSDKSYCLLIPESLDDLENERLQTMVETNDGFILAEKDLQLRGAGQFLGTRQSGYSDFQLASLTDIHLIEKARRYAQALFNQDPDLNSPSLQPLAYALQRSWGGGKGDIS